MGGKQTDLLAKHICCEGDGAQGPPHLGGVACRCVCFWTGRFACNQPPMPDLIATRNALPHAMAHAMAYAMAYALACHGV